MTSTTASEEAAPLLRAGFLTLIAGWADAAGYLRFHVFAGNMTGNTVLVGVSAGAGRWAEAAARFAVVAAYVGGVLVARLLARPGYAAAAVFAAAAAVLLAASLSQSGPGEAAILLLALGMGLQNGAVRRFGGLSLNTTFLTGDLVQFVDGLAARLSGKPADARLLRLVPAMWLSYVLGALLGALWLRHLPLCLLPPGLLLPCALLLPA